MDYSLTIVSNELVEKNRAYISSIIRAIEYCGRRQGIALGGHRDDGQLLNDKEPNVNRGNFHELIFLMCELDNNFKESILSSKRNANYLSKATQNDLLLCIKSIFNMKLQKRSRTTLNVHSTVYLLMRL